MDKRWIYIIIILIIGFSALYYIVDTSTTVGSAIVGINAFTFTVPDSFNIENNDHGFASLINRQSNEHIIIKDLGKNKPVDENFEKEVSAIESNEDFTIVNNTTETYNNVTSPVIYYKNLPNDTIFRMSVFSQYNHTFLLKSTNFKDIGTLNKNTHYVLDTLKPDQKKKQS